MSKKNGLEGLITATGIDQGALDSLISGAKKNRSAMSKKQRYDQERVRVRVDVPEPVRDLLREVAEDRSTSVNDIGTLLLVYGLAVYFEQAECEDSEIDRLLQASASFSRSPRKAIEYSPDVVMTRLQKAVAKAAETLPSAGDDAPNGADDGADKWGGWLDS